MAARGREGSSRRQRGPSIHVLGRWLREPGAVTLYRGESHAVSEWAAAYPRGRRMALCAASEESNFGDQPDPAPPGSFRLCAIREIASAACGFSILTHLP